MSRSIKEIKRMARLNLLGHYRAVIAALVLLSLIPMLLELPFTYVLDQTTILSLFLISLVELLINIIAEVMSVGYTMMHMKISRGQEYRPRDIFYCFRNSANHYFFGTLLRMAVRLVVSIPLFYAVIKLLYSQIKFGPESVPYLLILLLGLLLRCICNILFSMYNFVLLDQEEMPVKEVFITSFTMLRGHYGQLFLLYLSFLGMEFLSIISFTIGGFWVKPYLLQSRMMFYKDLIGETAEKHAEESSQQMDPEI